MVENAWEFKMYLNADYWIHVKSCQLSCFYHSDAYLVILSFQRVLPRIGRLRPDTFIYEYNFCKTRESFLFIFNHFT